MFCYGKLRLLATALVVGSPCAAQTITDGDTLKQGGAAGRSVVCQEKDRDQYGRTVAICRANGEDLGAILVREGLAWAFTRYSVDYVEQQEEARRASRGVHEHDCVPAWEWRAQIDVRNGWAIVGSIGLQE